jgi:hypothetical protein
MGPIWSCLLLYSRSLERFLFVWKYIAFGMRFFHQGFIQGNSAWKFPHYNLLNSLSWTLLFPVKAREKMPTWSKPLIF